MRSVVSKRWPTRPFSLNLLGSEEDRFVWKSFGKILPKVSIYPKHFYDYFLNDTCFFLGSLIERLILMSEWPMWIWARSKDSGKWNSILQVQVGVPDMKVKAGPKQDPKQHSKKGQVQFQSGYKKFNRRKLRETILWLTVGAPSVEESCSQAVVMNSFFFRFRRENSLSCTSGLKNLFFSANKGCVVG